LKICSAVSQLFEPALLALCYAQVAATHCQYCLIGHIKTAVSVAKLFSFFLLPSDSPVPGGFCFSTALTACLLFVYIMKKCNSFILRKTANGSCVSSLWRQLARVSTATGVGCVGVGGIIWYSRHDTLPRKSRRAE
jgi:hypothetical protein